MRQLRLEWARLLAQGHIDIQLLPWDSSPDLLHCKHGVFSPTQCFLAGAPDMNSWTRKVTACPQPPIQEKILNSRLVQKKHGGIDVQVKLVLVVDQRERNEIP